MPFTITYSWIKQAQARAEPAAEVTLPIDQFKKLLEIVEQSLMISEPVCPHCDNDKSFDDCQAQGKSAVQP